MLKRYIFILLPIILLNNSSNSTDFYKGIEHLSNWKKSKNFISKQQYSYYNYTFYNNYQDRKYIIFDYLFPENTSIDKIPVMVIPSLQQQKLSKTKLDINKIYNIGIKSNIKILSKLPNSNTNLNNTNRILNNKQNNNNNLLCNLIQDQIDNLQNNYVKKTVKQSKNNIKSKNKKLNKNSITKIYNHSVLNNTSQDEQNKSTITDITNNTNNNNKKRVNKEYEQIEEQNTKYNNNINSMKLTFNDNNIEANNSTEGSKHDYNSEDDNKNEDYVKQNSEQNINQYESNSNNIEINKTEEEDTSIDTNKNTENNSNDMENYSANKTPIKKLTKKEMKLIQLNNKRKRKNKMKLNNNKKQEQTEDMNVMKQNDLNNQQNIVIKETTEKSSNEINVQNNNQIYDNKILNNVTEQINENIIIEENKDEIKNDKINNNIITENKIDNKIEDKKEENNEELKTNKKKKHKNKGRYKYKKSLIENKQEDKQENKKEKNLNKKEAKVNKCGSYSCKKLNIDKEIKEQIKEIEAQIQDFKLDINKLHLTLHGDDFGARFANSMYININERNDEILNRLIEYYNIVLSGKKFNEFNTIDKLIIYLSKIVIDTQILNKKQYESKNNDIILIQISDNNINNNLREWIQYNTTSSSSEDIDSKLFLRFIISKTENKLNQKTDDYQINIHKKIQNYFNPIMLYMQKHISISDYLYLRQKQLNSDLLIDEDREYLIKEYSKYLLPKIISIFYSSDKHPVRTLLGNLLTDIIFYTNSSKSITELKELVVKKITDFVLDCCNKKYVDYLRELKTNEISQVEVDKLFNSIKNKQMKHNEIKLRIMDSVFSNAMNIHLQEMPNISGIHGMQGNMENQIDKNCIII